MDSIIFSRFPETSTAHIPLHLIYYYGVSIEEAYYISMNDLDLANGYWKDIKLNIDTVKLLKRQISRIVAAQIIFHYSTDKLVINLQTGKQISPYQVDYITKVIRREIDPLWSIKRFSQKIQASI